MITLLKIFRCNRPEDVHQVLGHFICVLRHLRRNLRRLDLKRFGRLIDQVRIYNPDAKDNIKEYHVVRPIPQTQFDGMPDWTTLGQNEGY